MIVPKSLVVREPFAHRGKSLGDEPVPAFAAVPLFGHKTRVEQYAEVLRNGRAAGVEMSCDGADRIFGLSEEIEHLAPCRMADRSEHVCFVNRCSYHHDRDYR